MSGVKGKSGRRKGYKHTPREKGQIRVGRLIQIAHDIAENKDRGDYRKLGARVSMIATLLRKELPDKSAADLTSGGEKITIERVLFKQPEEQGENKNDDVDTGAYRVPDPDDR